MHEMEERTTNQIVTMQTSAFNYKSHDKILF